MSNEPSHRLPIGLGVLDYLGEIVVYEIEGNKILWARPVGRDCLPLTDELRTAVWADRSRS